MEEKLIIRQRCRARLGQAFNHQRQRLQRAGLVRILETRGGTDRIVEEDAKFKIAARLRDEWSGQDRREEQKEQAFHGSDFAR